MTRIRTYSELRRFYTFEERYEYLRLAGEVGASTFGYDRYLNQRFYRSAEWKLARDAVIVRDHGCDLGILGYEIYTKILIHHMNPLTRDDIEHADENMFNPEYLITTTQLTHNAIHYGDKRSLPRPLTERRRGDTTLW